jgi:hypothetical protein
MENQNQIKNKHKVTYHQRNSKELRIQPEIILPISLILALTVIIFSLVFLMPKAQYEFINSDLKNTEIKQSNKNATQKQFQQAQKIQIEIIFSEKTIDKQNLQHHQALHFTVQPAQNPARFYARLSNAHPLIGRNA